MKFVQKILNKYLDTNIIKACFSFALIYCLLFNSSVFLYKFDHYKASLFWGIIEIAKDFIYLTVSLFICFFGLAINRQLFIWVGLFLFITGALASYYLFMFGIAPTLSMMPSIFGTNVTEASELLSARLIVWIIFSLSIFLFALKHFNIQSSKSFFTKILSAICLFILVNSIISPPFRFMKTYYPIQYLHNSYKYFFRDDDRFARVDISKEYQFNFDKVSEEIIGVLVIGESARFDHFGINGYSRQTTPLLATEKNLVSFPARSCANLTYASVQCMMSRYGESDFEKTWKENSFLSVLASGKFRTSWIASQSLNKYYRNRHLGTIYDDVNFSIVPGGSALYKMNDLDTVMIPYVKHLVEEEYGKKFLVIHTSGSHWNYSYRHPPEFAKFTPGCTNSLKSDQSVCASEELVNSYDNSILFTDFFLHEIINIIREKNSFLIYVSDHGESLGENGKFGHGCAEDIPEQRNIPFLVWYSDQFLKNNPAKIRSLNSWSNKTISHDHLFHSTLDCLNIESTLIDPSYSLCR